MQSASDVISSLFWCKEPAEQEENEEQQVLEQFVQSVDDFSSQYGSEISVSYTAFNLRGPPSNFPDYGDYPQAFVMRTYGTWWEEVPSATENYMPQNNNNCIPSQDFVEVSFGKEVYPLEVSIFETYNPGALVRIWAKGPTAWMLLWEGEPEYVVERPRIFTPTIRQIDVPTRVLRLEFNHKLLPYYTELDAVMLKGRFPLNDLKEKNSYTNFHSFCTPLVVKKGQLMNKILEANLHEKVGVDIDTGPPNGDFQKLPSEALVTCNTGSLNLHQAPVFTIQDETALTVMSYLDLQSLCRCAQVNRHFHRLASDSILYKSIDLRPFWHCVNNQVLCTLSQRCKHLQKLDLSWCGSHGMIESHVVVQFLQDCGRELTHLRMNCCRFVDTDVLKEIVDNCPHLEELCLRSIVDPIDWKHLKVLRKLKRLDVYRTDITTFAIAEIIKANPLLEHLNVGSCKMITSMDLVAYALGSHCPNLKSVDFWKSYSLTPMGIRELGKCEGLQELDVGWCLQAGSSGEWLQSIASGELRKLFLGALRGVCDRDLRALVSRAPKLTQLDLLGVRAVTPDICSSILAECKDLRLLDVSFCDQIQESQVQQWRRQYPHVSIKRSFQAPNTTGTDPDVSFLSPDLP